ncbi:MAG: hypothetical protein H6983_25740, partial [Ectothiorhodospiraceae bacterium]|nr:hypothetical protein [Ectothiorhodospiraceae bacterium]
AAAPLLAAYRADILLVACFAHWIPPAVRAAGRLGCLNLHPSLLPAYRGRSPVFHQLRDGRSVGGVTLHHVVDRIDAGPVVARMALGIPAGIALADLERALARAGATLLARLLVAGRPGAGVAQDEAAATDAPFPTAADRVIHPGWDADRAWRFLRGVAGPSSPVLLTGIDAAPVAIGEAVRRLRPGETGETGTHLLRVGFRGGDLLLRPVGGVTPATGG